MQISFKQKVIQIVNSIPFGTVASYGQVALLADSPRAARQVGWILNKLEGKTEVPWWRIINNSGRISIKGSHYNALDQKERLLEEGIIVDEDFNIDIEKYRYKG